MRGYSLDDDLLETEKIYLEKALIPASFILLFSWSNDFLNIRENCSASLEKCSGQ